VTTPSPPTSPDTRKPAEGYRLVARQRSTRPRTSSAHPTRASSRSTPDISNSSYEGQCRTTPRLCKPNRVRIERPARLRFGRKAAAPRRRVTTRAHRPAVGRSGTARRSRQRNSAANRTSSPAGECPSYLVGGRAPPPSGNTLAARSDRAGSAMDAWRFISFARRLHRTRSPRAVARFARRGHCCITGRQEVEMPGSRGSGTAGPGSSHEQNVAGGHARRHVPSDRRDHERSGGRLCRSIERLGQVCRQPGVRIRRFDGGVPADTDTRSGDRSRVRARYSVPTWLSRRSCAQRSNASRAAAILRVRPARTLSSDSIGLPTRSICDGSTPEADEPSGVLKYCGLGESRLGGCRNPPIQAF